MGDHIINGEFQSDKYPTCPRGKVPLSVKDPTAQDLLWEYASRRQSVDAEFSADLRAVLLAAGYRPAEETGAGKPIADLMAGLHGAEVANAAGRDVASHSDAQDLAVSMASFIAAMDNSNDVANYIADKLRPLVSQRNWYECAYTAGKQKLIESAIEKRLEPIRTAARALSAQIDNLGAFVDDNDPRVMATAGPLGAAQVDLWAALGLSIDEEHARMQADIADRCAVCGWALAERIEQGCVRGNCSYRPRPQTLYAPERAALESPQPDKEHGRG